MTPPELARYVRRLLPSAVLQLLGIVALDLRPRSRSAPAWRWLLASAIAVAGSLLADKLIVHVATAAMPTTAGYPHFQFSDYAKLTVIGVVGACIGWPLAVWSSSVPRAAYARVAVAVSAVLLLPDLWILEHGQPLNAVAVLMLMHLAIAVVTWSVMVLVAPPSAPARSAAVAVGR